MGKSKFYQIKNITEHEYTLVGCDGSVITLPIQEVDKTASAFTIQDAKDGDVLANENMVLIFKCFEEPSYRQHIIAHIGLDTCGYIQITNDSWNLGLDSAYPATKEQRELLFQKMKEAGYEWDVEKKELKKIEQKPTWSEDEKIRKDIIKVFTGEIGFTTKEEAKKYIAWLEKQGKQKTGWDEEDVEMIDLLISILEINHPNKYFKSTDKGGVNMRAVPTKKIINWLKSLKERMKGE